MRTETKNHPLPRILIVDEKLATTPSLKAAFLARTGLIEPGTRPTDPVQPVAVALFSHGQTAIDRAWINDCAAIQDTVAAMLAEPDGCALVLLNARLSLGEAQGDNFGEFVHDRLASRFPNLPLVLFTSQPQSSLRLELGSRYLSKHNLSTREIRECMLSHARMTLPQTRRLLLLPDEVVVEAPKMIEIFRDAYIHADDPAPVLLLGESGVGKEVVARYLHAHSQRQGGSFVAENMAAIAPELQESELFGHERGAFTGALARKHGLFERANGGTLFLDEVGDMPLALQVKLLRALQERVVRRVGGTEEVRVDVRVVAATSRNLHALMAEGRFRPDLYFRLSAVTIAIPPLRDRPGDIQPMARFFLQRCQVQHGRTGMEWTSDALGRLCRHPMPGNVRELENLVQCLVGRTGSYRQISVAEVEHALGNIPSPPAPAETEPEPPAMRQAVADYPADATKGALPRFLTSQTTALGRIAVAALEQTRRRNGAINMTAAMNHLFNAIDMPPANCRNEWEKICRMLGIDGDSLPARLDRIVERYGTGSNEETA